MLNHRPVGLGLKEPSGTAIVSELTMLEARATCQGRDRQLQGPSTAASRIVIGWHRLV